MATPTRKYLEMRMELLEKQLADLEYKEARFGTDDDYEVETVLSWYTRYHNASIVYVFVAIKVTKDKWFTTSQYDKIMTFDELVDKYLSRAVDDKVYVVTKWGER